MNLESLIHALEIGEGGGLGLPASVVLFIRASKADWHDYYGEVLTACKELVSGPNDSTKSVASSLMKAYVARVAKEDARVNGGVFVFAGLALVYAGKDLLPHICSALSDLKRDTQSDGKSIQERVKWLELNLECL